MVQSIVLFALQIRNSLGDKFSHWHSQNQTLIGYYEKKNLETKTSFLVFEQIILLTKYVQEL